MNFIVRNLRLVSMVLFVIGTLLFVTGWSIWFTLPKIRSNKIESNLRLSPDNSEIWDAFIEPPVPIYMAFRFLNVDNPVEVRNSWKTFDVKPIFTEFGPYVYREVRRKVNVTVGGGNSIYYSNHFAYIYDQQATDAAGCFNGVEGRRCRDTDTVKVLNPLIAVLPLLLEFGINTDNVALKYFINLLLEEINSHLSIGSNAQLSEQDDLFFNASVDNFLFKGQETYVLSLIWDKIAEFAPILPNNITLDDIYAIINEQMPQLSDGKFAFFKGKNNTTNGSVYRINNGQNYLTEYLSIIEYNGQAKLDESWWIKVPRRPSEMELDISGICLDIKGTDGSQFPPGIKKEQKLWLFVSDLCRSIWLEFEEESEVYGFNTFRFRPPYSVFNMSNPDNFCYCSQFYDCVTVDKNKDAYDIDSCRSEMCMDGVINVGRCFGGAPIVMSIPHFYKSDPQLLQPFLGLHPNGALHETYIDIDPITGVVFNAHKRIQINLMLKGSSVINILSEVPEEKIVFPLMWADEYAEMDPGQVHSFRAEVQTLFKIFDGLSIGLGLIVGALCIIVSWGILYIYSTKNSTVKRQPHY